MSTSTKYLQTCGPIRDMRRKALQSILMNTASRTEHPRTSPAPQPLPAIGRQYGRAPGPPGDGAGAPSARRWEGFGRAETKMRRGFGGDPL